jgi:hypothetical protein
VSHPGINFLIKHIGCIFRRLFSLALEDVKHGEELSSTFRLLPSAVEKHFLREFDDLLWGLMVRVASVTHDALEPMVRSVAFEYERWRVSLTLTMPHSHDNHSLVLDRRPELANVQCTSSRKR